MLSGNYQTAMSIAFISAIVALSLVVLTGYVGQISLTQMTFAGLGTYFCAEFASSAGIPFPFPIILAGLALVPVRAAPGPARAAGARASTWRW